ncbi:WD40-repeat-containing domain protein, partial [Polychytrium aggregatum]|uniref:WD40-repeat-containing domain protein n=1 Tax=Polychytrium aggregatum TaxID=110093 RepID=UPI0022FE9884
MALPTISYRYAFGIKTDVKENIGFLDEQTVIYPAGSNLIIYNAENKSQRFITMTEHCESITSLCISNTRRYCAVAERSTVEKPQVVIYDLHTLRRKKVLVPSSEIESKEYVALAFSSDAKFIITQTGAPDWMMYFWLWEKGKLMASFRTTQDKPTSNLPPPTGFKDRDAGGTINQVSFNPLDSNQICTIGNGVFRLYRYQDGGCKQLSFSKFEPRNFTSHAWICDDRLVVGSEDGRLLIFESTGELKIEIVYSNGTTNAPKQIYGIVAYLKGFIVAGEGGFMSVYEKEDPGLAGQVSAAAIAKELFRKTREYSLPFDNVRVLTLAISPSEDNIICTLENSQIYTLMVTSSEMKGDEAKFNLLAQPFHHGPIIGMDICIRKPLIVTCSSDKSIRVWNYLENTSELVKYFPEEAFSVAIHPNGLYILVGFGDKLKLMNLLIDDIRPFREFTIRGCRECQFSTGGQYFAAAHGNAIQLYNTWNFENIGNLKGHSGKVRTIAFTSDDSRIITASIDGTIFEWSLRDVYGFNGIGIKKESESTVKNCSYTSVVTSPDGRSAYAVGSDKIIKEIMEGQLLKQVEVDIPLTQIAISHGGKVLFAG